MTEIELRDLLRQWQNIPLIAQHIIEFPKELELLVKLATNDDQAENWRAMWMLEKIYDQTPEKILPYLSELTQFLFRTKNSGKKRHLLKLISLNEIKEENMAPLLNFCIETFTNAKEDVAVRVHAMQILYNIAQREKDFTHELIELIEHEIEFHGSAGISSRGRKLLAKLRQNQF